MEDDFRLGNLKLVAFAAHGLDQHGQMQLASARYTELVGRVRVFDPQGDIGLKLFHQPLAQLSGCRPLAFAARQRRCVHAESHAQGRLIDFHQRQRDRIFAGGNCLADIDIRQARDRDDLARFGAVHFRSVQTLVDEDLRNFARDVHTLAIDDNNVLARLDGPGVHPSNGDTAFVVIIIQGCSPKL